MISRGPFWRFGGCLFISLYLIGKPSDIISLNIISLRGELLAELIRKAGEFCERRSLKWIPRPSSASSISQLNEIDG